MADPRITELEQQLDRGFDLMRGDQPNWDDLYERYGKKYGVPPAWLRAVNQQESSEGRDLYNHESGASGPMQIMEGTNAALGGGVRFDPETAMDHAARLLAAGIRKFGSDAPKVFASYYGGMDQKKWGEKTLRYGQEVAARLKQAPPAEAAPRVPTGGDIKALEDHLEQTYGGEKPAPDLAPATAKDQPRPVDDQGNQVPWGLAQEIPNAFLLGFGPQIIAGTRAGWNSLTGQGDPSYAHALNEEEAARRGWVGDAPITSMATDVIGSALPIGAGLRGAKLGVRAGLDAADAAAPWLTRNVLRPAAEFLGGQAGRTAGKWTGKPLRTASRLAQGGVEGAAAGAMASDLNPDEGIGEQAGTGGVVGAGVNALLGPVGGYLANRVWGRISPALARLGLAAHDLGLPVRPGQLAGNKPAKALDLKLNQADNEAQLEKYQGVLAKTFDEEDLTPTSVQRAWRRLDAAKARLEAAHDVGLDRQFLQQFSQHGQDVAGSGITDAPLAQIQRARAAVADVISKYNGVVPGSAWQDLLRKGGPIDLLRNTVGDPGRQYYGQQLHEMVQGLRARSMPPGMAQEYGDVMLQRKILTTLKPVIGQGVTRGSVVSPQEVSRVLSGAFDQTVPGPGPRGVNTLAQVGPHLPKVTPEGEPVAAPEGHGPMAALNRLTGGHGPAAVLGMAGGGAHYLLNDPYTLWGGLGAAAGTELGKAGYKAATRSPAFQQAALEAASEGRSVWNHLGMPNPLIPPAVVATNAPKDKPVPLWYNGAGGFNNWDGQTRVYDSAGNMVDQHPTSDDDISRYGAAPPPPKAAPTNGNLLTGGR